MRPTVIGDRGAWSGALSGLAFAVAIGGGSRLAKGPFPRPGSSAEQIRTYYHDSKSAARFSTACQAVAVLAQARFTASVARLAAQHTQRPALLRATAIASGAAAAACLAASAATQSTLTMPIERDDDAILDTTRRVFATGGPVHGVAYGVFTAVLAESARNAAVLGPAGTRVGWASAAASLLSPAYFRWEQAGWLIPIGRFTGYLVSGIVGARLSRA